MPKNNLQKLTIFIPCHEPWDRTADFLRQTARRLSQEHTVVLVLSYQGKFWLTALIQRILGKKVIQPMAENVIFSTPFWLFPGERLSAIRVLNQKIWMWWLWLQFKLKNPRQKTWLWLFSPEDWFLPHTFPGASSLYDCVDDHSQLDAKVTVRLKKQEEILIKTAGLFFTNSHILAALHAKTRRPNAIVVQGFDTALWPKKTAASAVIPKTILLMGSLDERVDWPLLTWLMQKLPNYTLNLAGPIAATVSKKTLKLLSLPNVQYHGSLERKALHTLLIQTQLCLIPYNTDLPAAKHCFPMKVLEFFAYGKPVIASDITELQRYVPYVEIAKTQTEWLKLFQSKTQNLWPTELQKAEREIAWSHRYEVKISQILSRMYTMV
jgi:glycosyltransferase involved in cell wall biosynthesis